MSDEAWGELFAKAAGAQEEEARPPPQPSFTSENTEKRRKKRNRPQRSSGYHEMLASRMNVPGTYVTLPAWVRLGGLLSSSKTCPCWEEAEQKAAAARTCKHCHHSPLQHKLVLNETFGKKKLRLQEAWPFSMFCNIRNLRCAAVAIAMGEGKPFPFADAARMESQRASQMAEMALTTLPPGEAELLSTKWQAVVVATDTLFDQAKLQRDGNDHLTLFEEAVRLMISCDDAYYRLYYLQITRAILRESASSLYLPHPTEYFHVPYLAWDGMDDPAAMNAFLEFAVSFQETSSIKYDGDNLRAEILDRYGLDLFQADGQHVQTDPLAYLHRNRFLETARLFWKSGWNSRSEAVQQTRVALRNSMGTGRHHDGDEETLSHHETPAPPILTEWRDCCRDRLCNLYAYATVPHGTEVRIKKCLDKAGITEGMIEIGAGTGFIAALLQKAGVNVLAWDVRPTDGSNKNPGHALNEYHGYTPPFCSIGKGDPDKLRRHFPNYKAEPNAAAAVALLLCYPPPDCPMAEEALKTYLHVGGRFFVHIGEFGGLTGSTSFEDLLIRSFECVDRFPCLSWGTDAADVSIWVKRAFPNGSKHSALVPSLLLPCSLCGKREATKRCSLVRHVVYCGEKCCERHSPALSVHLALNMIPMRAESLSFQDDLHFRPIRPSEETFTG